MEPISIFGPVAILALWTLSVVALVPVRRFRAAFAKQVGAHDFKYGESSRVPPEVSIPNRNFMNLLEAPVLFYVACIILYETRHVDHIFLAMAWSYLALRICHSLVHLTYNNVFHRLTFYGLSNLLLVAMWLRLSIQVLASA